MRSEPSALQEIIDDMDALTMANSVDLYREIYVLVRIVCSGPVETTIVPEEIEEEEEMVASDTDSKELRLCTDRNKNRNDEDLKFYDSNYDFINECDGDEVDTNQTKRAIVVVTGEPLRSVHEIDTESNYVDPNELQSCSFIDEDELINKRPNYS